MTNLPLLSSLDMARFASRGFLRFNAVVPDEINAQFLAEAGEMADVEQGRSVRRVFGEALATNAIPEVAAGTALSEAYPKASAVRRLLDLLRANK